MRFKHVLPGLAVLGLMAAPLSPLRAQAPTDLLSGTAKSHSDTILLTVFLKHDQSRTVDEIQQIQKRQSFYKRFPPAGTKVVSWYVMMGIGQVVTLQVPANKLRAVNTAIEKTAWKAFHTEFYATYNLYPYVRNQLANKAVVDP